MKNNFKYKPLIIKVNISNSFMVRTKCIKCGEEPRIYFHSNRPYLFKDPQTTITLFNLMKKWIKTRSNDWYLNLDPKHFKNASSFAHIVDYKGYNPRLHKSKGVNLATNITQYISCWSGCSIWSFSDLANQERREISQRKGRYSYSDKFIRIE